MIYCAVTLTKSAKTPAAVTSAPAPGPFTTNGVFLYLDVVNEMILSLQKKKKNG